jgi:hypothetical protein
MEKRAADLRIAIAATSLKMFFSDITWTIFYAKKVLESA